MVVRTENIKVLTLEDFANPNIGFIILPLHTFHQQGNFLSVPHQRMFYTIIYFEEDCGRFAIDQRIIQAKSGEAISIAPSSVCTYEINDKAKGWVMLFLDAFFTKRYNDNVLHDFSFLKVSSIYNHLEDTIDIPRWCLMMDAMYDEFKRLNADSKSILRSYLNIVLGMLDRCSDITVGIPNNNEKEGKIRTFEQLLEKYYRKERFPSFYAEKLNISTNYLNRICRERRNKKVGDLIRGRVLLEAERLLFHTFKTVSEISFELGFDSSSYFITFFKKNYGISPEEFRKQQK
ncbi:AraC family transcriptional regulator [Sphingobacterium faecale]|uniref:AraC family transcriptional regulator n=1 Tax=Sphingobacterium faecale TaxID=2803775 RepID=A0ABS1R867_9SPHI|nr:helix-turn-helix transcriptional regulator [Sphingobacterium faecale]MBL1410021.1 AraC family transcriptional regulator [Sphingobacterium faecale]